MYDMDGEHFRIPLSFVIVFLGVGFGGHQVSPFPFQQLHSMPKKRAYWPYISHPHTRECNFYRRIVVTFIQKLTNPELKYKMATSIKNTVWPMNYDITQIQFNTG